MEDPISYLEAMIIVLFGLILPTADVGTDCLLAITIIVGKEVWKETRAQWAGAHGPELIRRDFNFCGFLDENRYVFGAITLLFPTFSFLFTAYHWWNMENVSREGGSGRLNTLPLLLAQIWPQYRAIRLLYLGLVKKSSQWRREQQVLLENVSSLEPFTESVPTVYWILILCILTGCVGPVEVIHKEASHEILRELAVSPFGMASFATSFLSASYGLTNFLRVGPLKVIPGEPASGFGHLSFWLIFFSTASSLLTKGCVLAFSMWEPQPNTAYTSGLLPNKTDRIPVKWTYGDLRPWWDSDMKYILLATFIPNLLMSFVILVVTFRFDALKLAIRYPAVVLMPVFTPFTFSQLKNSSRIQLNYSLTALNLLITLVGILTCGFCFTARTINFDSQEIVNEPFNEYVMTTSLPMHLVCSMFTTYLILTDLGSCTCTFSLPLSKHRPVKQAKGLTELLHDQEIAEHDTIEMETTVQQGRV